MKLNDILQNEKFIKKNKNYLEGNSQAYKDNMLETALNMRTVKEGTAIAGAFAIWVVETASVVGADMHLAREIANKMQRASLDAKHSQGDNGYKSATWAKICEVANTIDRHSSEKDILERIISICEEKESSTSNTSNESFKKKLSKYA